MDRKRGSRSHSPQHKRQKVTHDTARSSPAPLTADADGNNKLGTELCAGNLATGLLRQENVERLRQEYARSEPYKYARIETLFQDDLLKKVKDECLAHLNFTEKETDIYRVSCIHYDPPARFWGLRVLCVAASPPGRRELVRFLCSFVISHEWTQLPLISISMGPFRLTKREISPPSTTSQRNRSLFSQTSSHSAIPCTLKNSETSCGL